MCNSEGECRPLGFLIGLPFSFLCLLLSIVGTFVWIIGTLLSCICPCFLCLTVVIEIALELIKAPLHVMTWFISMIPC
ncbi:signaling peptide TAXIMIN 1-like [Vicia villosa]|uniref:signaling peptide TAXIMIN 1-like n=1 Tax=Vicia villosa TaxID=3911 RepID=UPI00273CABDE|nr:signaling peptide TAXIMIN 1-like [Vicia villosa]XP_058756219.1 signaling peptide TAXIMIN 1-like [Vicia villosa]